MKKILEDREGFDDLDSYDDDDIFANFNDLDNIEEIENVDIEEETKHLCYLLRQMFNNKGINNISVYNEESNIIIDAFFSKTTRLEKLIEVFEMASKIKKEILEYYVDGFQMLEEKDGSYTISFEFILHTSKNKYGYDGFGYDGFGYDDMGGMPY